MEEEEEERLEEERGGAGRESEAYLPLLPPMPLTQLHFSLSATLQCTVLHCTVQA